MKKVYLLSVMTDSANAQSLVQFYFRSLTSATMMLEFLKKKRSCVVSLNVYYWENVEYDD